MNLHELINNYLLTTGQRCFAVEDHGRLIGLITLRDVSRVPREHWEQTTVRENMRSLQELHTVSPGTSVLDALKIMARCDINQLPVVAHGSLQGIVTRSQLVDLLQVRAALGLSGAYRPPPELTVRNEVAVDSMSRMWSRHPRV